ncbi:MAG TPA: FecR domain-containing protein [Bacteroidales bacterium]|nr:DUF4974 domain-containing protein [Bacteroidales bacterium]HNR40806.1 FecR domain-containing protein [Bacteroidales bacterium]
MANENLDKERLNQIFRGNLTGEDEIYLRKIFCDLSIEEELEHTAKKQWYEILRDKIPEERNLEHILYKIHFELNTKQSKSKDRTKFRNIVNWVSRIAAILFLPLLIFSGLQFFTGKNKNDFASVEIKAPAWARVRFSLPDGSTGWLNSGSSVKYRGDFISNRKVTLDGEAYFDVRTNPERPFEVSTDEIIVTATGTKFNVASYKNEKNVEVVLEEGKIVIKDREMTESVTMNPDDLLVYDKSTRQLHGEKVQSEKYIAWTEGKLVFRNDPIDIIALRIGRWYNVDVEIQGNNFQDVRLRATFINENLEEVLYFLKKALPIDYKVISGGIMCDDETYKHKKILITTKH